MSSSIRVAARRASTLSRQITRPSTRSIVTCSPVYRRSVVAPSVSCIGSRRYASSAAAVQEAEEEVEEKVWPVRVLPELSETDKPRLRRQRNLGM